jgi:starch synthase
LRVLHVASEAAPLSQTGGLGQVAGALPVAQAETGAHAAILTPLYRGAEDRVAELGGKLEKIGTTIEEVLCGFRFTATLRRWRHRDVDWLLLDCPELYDRSGLYDDPAGGAYPDNAIRYAMLARAAARCAADFDVVHAHDWQAGLVAAYLADRRGRPGLIFTIHNLAFQGVFPKNFVEGLGLQWGHFNLEQIEFYDQVSFLKAGAALSDVITTVSPKYAAEIQTPAFGCGLHGFFAANADKLVGVLNGIDTEGWNPATDPAIAARYSVARPAGKQACRAALIEEVGLPVGKNDLLAAAVTRLSDQKGPDLLADLVPELARLGVRLLVLGSGEPALEHRLRTLAKWFGEHLWVRIGFDETQSHRIFAGADAVVMPSRFEPCGLTQLIAMRYGTLPVASAVGGLADTIVDPGDAAIAAGRGNGFLFEQVDLAGLRWALGRAAALHANNPAGWRRAIKAAMSTDWSWKQAAARYLEIYDRATVPRRMKVRVPSSAVKPHIS